MPTTFQDITAAATQKASTDLAAALLALPEDKRNWSPSKTARTALNMAAECAIVNGLTIKIIETRTWQQFEGGQEKFFQQRDALAAGDWETLQTMLIDNTSRFAVTIRAVGNEALDIEIETPYGSMPLSGMMSYPYWNMKYHEGQINYIASILEGLEEIK